MRPKSRTVLAVRSPDYTFANPKLTAIYTHHGSPIGGQSRRMSTLEQVLGLFLAGVALAAAARRVGAPYPVFLALGGALLALLPVGPSFTLPPELALALFVAPVLVFLSFVIGPHPMPLVFNGFELAGLLIALVTANVITSDGRSTWFEGLQLLSLYAVIGVAFFFA